MSEIKTAADLRRELEAAGAPASVIDTMISLTAPARREARVQAAMLAAITGMCTSDEQAGRLLAAIGSSASPAELPRVGVGADDGEGTPGDCACARGAAMCAVEAHIGVGGHAGAGGRGRGTYREPWAQQLGTGRANAADGGAWDAAMADAAARLSIAAGGTGGVEISCAGRDGLAATCGAASSGVAWSLEQERAICLQALSALLPDGHRSRVDPLPSDCRIVFSGTVSQWSAYLDEVCRIMAERWVEDRLEGTGRSLDASGVWESLRDGMPARLCPWAHVALGNVRDAQRAAATTDTRADLA